MIKTILTLICLCLPLQILSEEKWFEFFETSILPIKNLDLSPKSDIHEKITEIQIPSNGVYLFKWLRGGDNSKNYHYTFGVSNGRKGLPETDEVEVINFSESDKILCLKAFDIVKDKLGKPTIKYEIVPRKFSSPIHAQILQAKWVSDENSGLFLCSGLSLQGMERFPLKAF